MTVKILAIDPRWRHPARIAFMRQYLPEGCALVIPDSFEPEGVFHEAKTARVILAGQVPLNAELMAAAPNLCLVGKLGTGVDSIDVTAATAAGIPVAHSPGWLRGSARCGVRHDHCGLTRAPAARSSLKGLRWRKPRHSRPSSQTPITSSSAYRCPRKPTA